jgi:hypothetical protein
MSERKLIENSRDFFLSVNRLSGEAEWSDDELRAALASGGIDPSLFLAQVRSDVKKLMMESPHHWRNRARELRAKLGAQFAAAQRNVGSKLSRKELIGNIEATLARMPPALLEQFSFEHRNFVESSDEDLESLLVELECIQRADNADV